MKKIDEPWTDKQTSQVLQMISDGMRPYEIRPHFPDRSRDAVRSKIRNLLHGDTINEKRVAAAHSKKLPFIADGDHAKACRRNENQDLLFQAAMRAAIEAGLELMPKAAMLDYAEFRPAPFYPAPRVSYGSSPAALCAELGAR